MMALSIDGSVMPKTWSDSGILLFGGMLSLLGQLLTTIALKLEMAGKVALTLKSSQILFSFVFQVLIFYVSVCGISYIYLFRYLTRKKYVIYGDKI